MAGTAGEPPACPDAIDRLNIDTHMLKQVLNSMSLLVFPQADNELVLFGSTVMK